MLIGTKVGPTDWIDAFKQITPQCVEVWFRLDWAEKYEPLVEHLQKEGIPFGLHYWDMIEGKYFPSFLVEDHNITERSFESLCRTIELASKWKATYVNFHPESYRINLLDLDKCQIMTLDEDKPIDREQAYERLLGYMQKIQSFAHSREVTPFIGTVPKYMPSQSDYEGGRAEMVPMKSEGMETERYFDLAERGYQICFDIGHTIAQLLTEDRRVLFEYVLSVAKKLRDAIGLVHATTNLPPFNGVDSHQGITDQDFGNGVLPDREQMKELLVVFRDTDAWLVPEPQGGTKVVNYRALEKLVGEI